MIKNSSEFKLIMSFGFKAFLLIIGVQILFWSLLFLFPKTLSKNIGQETGYEFIDRISSDPSMFNQKKILVLGDSSASTAIHLKTLGSDAVTIGVWGSSPAESYFYFRQYLSTHSAPKCLLFTHLVAPEYYKAHAFWEFVMNYSKMPISFVSEIYNESRKANTFPGSEYSPLFFYLKYFMVKLKIFFVSQEVYQDKLRFSFSYRDFYDDRLKSLYSSGGEYIMDRKGLNAKGAWWEFLINPMKEDKYFDSYIEKIFNLAKEKNIKIYTFSPPFTKKAYFSYTDRINSLDDYLRRATEKHAGATFINLREFYWPSYYIDHAHLNIFGSEKFTNHINSLLDCN